MAGEQTVIDPVDTNDNPWDAHAPEYARWIAQREQAGIDANRLLARFLEVIGDVAGLRVLDAGCGEGFLARVLAARGARVTGIDRAPRLIQMARAKNPDGAIDYRLADLTHPPPELHAQFDRIGSYMVLNDVADYRAFVASLAALTKPGGRVVLALNNPYSFPVRGEGHVVDYFASGTRGIYGGMSAFVGGTVRYYHHTMEEYLDAFLDAGFRLAKFADVVHTPSPLPGTSRYPLFVVLAFEKP
jgi:2-polyprenyl-3-methyl-5-hydroxy-6-metoxy-1,4-benzoquinol methylase